MICKYRLAFTGVLFLIILDRDLAVVKGNGVAPGQTVETAEDLAADLAVPGGLREWEADLCPLPHRTAGVVATAANDIHFRIGLATSATTCSSL